MWEKIVLNLLANAVKFTERGGIHVTMVERDGMAVLTVADTGIGIAPQHLPHLFERFFRVEDARGRTQEGTGIGLSLVRELIHLHGGNIAVDSEPGRGSRFTVRIPLVVADPSADRRDQTMPVADHQRAGGMSQRVAGYISDLPTESTKDSSSVLVPAITAHPGDNPGINPDPREADAASSPARLLLVEDNADLRRHLIGVLGDRYLLAVAGNGRQALELALADPPDLVLSDVMMPEMDGIELTRRLRSDPRTATVPIVLLTARVGEEPFLEGLANGADDYLPKPFSSRQLLARVSSLIDLARMRRQILAAEETRRANAELTTQVQIRTADLVAANQELESFSYSVSHDLRAPLRAISGFAAIIVEDHGNNLPQDARDALNRVITNARRMGLLIDDLLAFSRFRRQELSNQTIDTGRLVRQCWDELRGDLGQRQVAFTVGDLPTCQGDRAMLKQVWLNLLGNALKYSRQVGEPQITVGVEGEPERPVFVVRDNGSGFDMRFADKLFQVFQRLHRDDEFEGTGIGLAIVHRIIVRHRGRIWAESQKGKGATFRFTLGTGSNPRIGGQP